jgi:GNAT superfamily N-acetyltransferase
MRPRQVATPPVEVVQIRPVRLGDEGLVRDFLVGLSTASQISRFFAGMTRPSASIMRSLLAADAPRDALVAVLAGTGEVMGHAMSYARSTTKIEIAVVVADDWQGRGYGSRLVAELLGRAAGRGARTVGMDVMGDNRKVLAMVHRKWPHATMRTASGTVEISAAF